MPARVGFALLLRQNALKTVSAKPCATNSAKQAPIRLLPHASGPTCFLFLARPPRLAIWGAIGVL